MAEAVETITLANNAQQWIDRDNKIANLLSTVVVTANASVNGASTSGNGFVNGIFGANVVTVYNVLRGGNVQSATDLVIGSNVSTNNTITVGNSSVNVVIQSTSIKLLNDTANLTLTIPTANQVASGDYYLNANGSYAQIDIPENAPVVATTSGLTAALVDSFEVSTTRAVSYITNVQNNLANQHSMSHLNVLYNGNTSPLYTEFGVMLSNGSIGEFSANANASHVRVFFTPTSSNTTVQLIKTSVPKV